MNEIRKSEILSYNFNIQCRYFFSFTYLYVIGRDGRHHKNTTFSEKIIKMSKVIVQLIPNSQ